ncbi:hypothetical protein Tco_0651015 [Tanacetum coccineum]
MTEAKDSEVYKITRADGSLSFHGDFQALLRRLDRQDWSSLFILRWYFNTDQYLSRQEVSTEEGNLEEDDQLEDRSRRK